MMKKEEKKHYLEILNDNKFYNEALSQAKSEEEKKKIRAFTEDVFISLIEGLSTIRKVVDEHPDKVAEVLEKRIPKEKQHG